MKKVGFIGLGSMGSAMANNLLESGYFLKVYNRTPQKAQPLVDKGAFLVKQPCELFDGPGSIVISMLANDRAVEEVVFGDKGLENGLKKDCIHLSMSSLSPGLGKKLFEHHQKYGAHFVAAPVFGPPTFAATRKLFICVSGNASAREHVTPILKELGQKTFDLGDNPSSSMIMKLMGNFLMLSASQSMAEALALGKHYGLEPSTVISTLTQSLFPSFVYELYGKRVAAQAFDPALFKLSLGLKDLTLLLAAAKEVHSIMPIAELIRQGLSSASAMGRDQLDWSALALFITEGNADAFKTP